MARNITEEISLVRDSSKRMITALEDIIKQDNDFVHYGSVVESLKDRANSCFFGLKEPEQLAQCIKIHEIIFEEGKKIICEFLETGKYHKIIKPEIYIFLGSRLFKIKKSDSWRGKKGCESGYKKEEKEALNAMIFVLLLVYRQQIEGKKFNRTAVISYIIRRIIKKSYTWDNKPENKEMFREAVEGYDKFEMIYAKDETVKEVGFCFTAMIHNFAEEITSEEEEVFKAAKAIADYVEFKQIKKFIFKEERNSTKKEIKQRLKKTLKKSGAKKYITKDFFSLLERISWGRNTIRWQGDGYVLDCSILAHMLETAIFGWLMGLEKNNLELAEDVFFVGLFHDLPEVWTDDIPSPCKDRIRLAGGEILRPLTEELERIALKKYFYPKLHPKVAEYCKMHIIFEELNEPGFHQLIKKADYFSADYELWWNIVCGSKDIKFHNILLMSYSKNRTPATTEVLRYMIQELSEVKFIRP